MSHGALTRSRSLPGSLVLVAIAILAGSALATPHPHTFSLDALSPSAVDPADLLNPGGPPPPTQVPAVNLGLQLGDDVDAVSAGIDAVEDGNIVFFSVDRASIGAVAGPMPPWDVPGQSGLNQQAGDIFVTIDQAGVWSVPVGFNFLRDNQNLMGEIPQVLPTAPNPGPNQDRLDALSFEEFDLNGDGAQDLAVYFSLDSASPSLPPAFSAADILLSAAVGGLGVYAPAASMGLLVDDDLDALALLDAGTVGALDPNVDVALFSLAPGSPTLATLGASPADVFMTGFAGTSFVRYPAASLGLLLDDNVDALEVQVPEPAVLALMVTGAVALVRRRRR